MTDTPTHNIPSYTREACVEWLDNEYSGTVIKKPLPYHTKPMVQSIRHYLTVTPPATADSADWDMVRKACAFYENETPFADENPVAACDRLRLSDLAKDEAIAGMAVAIKNQYATIAEQDKAIERLRAKLENMIWFANRLKDGRVLDINNFIHDRDLAQAVLDDTAQRGRV